MCYFVFYQYRVLYNHDFYIIQIIMVTAKSAAKPAAVIRRWSETSINC